MIVFLFYFLQFLSGKIPEDLRLKEKLWSFLFLA